MTKPTGKPVRLDDRLFDYSDDLIILCLPEFFREILLSLTDRPFWGKRVWGRELTENEVSRLEYGLYRLSQEECDMTINFSPTITISNNDNVSTGGDCTTPPTWQQYPWPGGTPCYPTPQQPEPPLDESPPVMPPDTPPSEWDAYRCKVANYAWEQIRQWLEKVAQVPNNLLTIGALLALLWAWLPASLLAFLGGAVLELSTLIWHWYALSEGFDEIADYILAWWDDHRDEIICKFYNMLDVGSTRGSIIADLLNDLAVWGASQPWWFEDGIDWMDSLLSKMLPYNLFLAPWRLVPPTGYVPVTSCQCDEEIPPVTSIGGDWWLVPVPQENFGTMYDVVPNNASGSISYAVPTVTMTPLTNLNYHEVELVQTGIGDLLIKLNDAYSDTVGGEIVELHGHYIEFAATYLNTMDRFKYSNAVGGAGGFSAILGHKCATYNSTEYATPGAYKTFIDSVDVNEAYDNQAMDEGKASYGIYTYGSDNPLTLPVRVWYIAKVQ